eukprot:TRINITY_DN26115_c0_g1_i1.p2 TRINITY_DN26115_c0_g1~~TRINITY_DN26115_c0_g1_i1.p2  ORF type:complete len:116 (+),score=16.46 TRINITY_DN26115_c0_g1_i1:89-436(+)
MQGLRIETLGLGLGLPSVALAAGREAGDEGGLCQEDLNQLSIRPDCSDESADSSPMDRHLYRKRRGQVAATDAKSHFDGGDDREEKSVWESTFGDLSYPPIRGASTFADDSTGQH